MIQIIDKIIVLLFWVFVGIIILTIIALPTVGAFFINRWLTNKGIKYIGLILLIFAPLWTVYEVYTAIYPTDSFYYSEFKEVTLREMPKSAQIIRKDASYPDFHGDYCSAALLSMSINDYKLLLNDLSTDKRITKEKFAGVTNSDEFDEVMGNIETVHITNSFTRHISVKEDYYLYIGFLDDKKTIVISKCVS